jgi:hypothetical protein
MPLMLRSWQSSTPTQHISRHLFALHLGVYYVCFVLCLQLQAEDLDERNVAELRKFDAAVALEILEHYSQADFSTVRNRRAYLAGAAIYWFDQMHLVKLLPVHMCALCRPRHVGRCGVLCCVSMVWCVSCGPAVAFGHYSQAAFTVCNKHAYLAGGSCLQCMCVSDCVVTCATARFAGLRMSAGRLVRCIVRACLGTFVRELLVVLRMLKHSA